ncbi:MAG: hypothetical protein MK101_10920 [Phycisphaerales bacterium]|nr:hypothetical protein [Phycisphaerales bacterium]
MSDARQAAIDVAGRLRQAGHEALLAGGCVRDVLLERTPKDWDVATSARPDEIRSVFKGARSVGEAFGVMLVRRHGHTIEVATFRSDGVYRDHRRPETVTFSDAEHDAQRRDFTINGLFMDPLSGDVIDHVNGRQDLEAGLIRAIGDPTARISEDHLRMLRAVRFAASLNFKLDLETADAIKANASSLAGVSAERIGEEFRRMLLSDGAVDGMELLAELGLLGLVPGGMTLATEQHFLHAAATGGLDWPARLAAVALDAGADDTILTDCWVGSLVLSNWARDGALAVLDIHRTLKGWDTMSVAGRRRCCGRDQVDSALALSQVDAPVLADQAATALATWRATAGGVLPRRLVDGHMLMEAGVSGGPELGRLLEAIYDAQLEGRVSTADQGLELARHLRDLND